MSVIPAVSPVEAGTVRSMLHPKNIPEGFNLPVAYDQSFEGEHIRGDSIYLESGTPAYPMVEWVKTCPADDIVDGKIDVIGPELSAIPAGACLPLAMCVEIAGPEMRSDFEAVLERQFHRFINYAQGIQHTGQRDCVGLKISKTAASHGFQVKHLGAILYYCLKEEYSRIVDRIQIKIYSRNSDVLKIINQTRDVYCYRDARTEDLTDEGVDIFYSCTLCQSVAPYHVCFVSPERAGMCGAYNWLDCQAGAQIKPYGPNQPITKNNMVDPVLGQWEGINDAVAKATYGKISKRSLYSIMTDPMTTCLSSECIAGILPLCNGIMTVDRHFVGITPCGMNFSAMMETVGNGMLAPGFMGHSKCNIGQRKFLTGDGGLLRLVWMPRRLKAELEDRISLRGAELGCPDLIQKIADETIGIIEEDVLSYLKSVNHPALSLKPIIG